MYLLAIVHHDDNVPIEPIRMFNYDETGRQLAWNHFLDECQTRITNWDQYSPDEIAAVMDNGYEHYGSSTIVLIDLTNTDGCRIPSRESFNVVDDTKQQLRQQRERLWAIQSSELKQYGNTIDALFAAMTPQQREEFLKERE